MRSHFPIFLVNIIIIFLTEKPTDCCSSIELIAYSFHRQLNGLARGVVSAPSRIPISIRFHTSFIQGIANNTYTDNTDSKNKEDNHMVVIKYQLINQLERG